MANTLLIRLARQAQIDGNFSALGQLINQTKSPQERGTLLGMLACEIAARKRPLWLANHVLKMSRRQFIDDYPNLLVARRQAKLLPRFVYDDEFCTEFLSKRESTLREQGLI